MGLRAVIYARYSSDSQKEESIEGQVRECKAYAERSGLEVVNTYIDRALSARTDNRPSFQRMIADSYHHIFDVVLVWKRDRFGRNRLDVLRYSAILKANKVKLTSVTENISEGSDGIILSSVLDGVNEAYSVDLSQKVRRGQYENVLKGKMNGGAPTYGYTCTNQRYTVNEEEAKVVKLIFETYANSKITIYGDQMMLKNKGIYNRAGKPFPHITVYRILHNRKYIGEYNYGGHCNKEAVPAIISQELWDKAVKRLKTNKEVLQSFKAKEDYVLTTRLFCGKCKTMLTGECGTSKTGKVYHYYKCNKVKYGHHCDLKPIRKSLVEDYVVGEVKSFLSDKNNIESLSRNIWKYEQKANPYIQNIQAQIDETEKKITRILNAIESGLNPTNLKERYNVLQKQKEGLVRELSKEQAKNPAVSEEELKDFFEMCAKIPTDTLEGKRKLIETFINVVYVNPDMSVDIYFSFKGSDRKIKLPNNIEESSTNNLDTPTIIEITALI